MDGPSQVYGFPSNTNYISISISSKCLIAAVLNDPDRENNEQKK